MKKIFILSLLVVFPLNLYCQQDSLIVLDSIYYYNWDSSANDWVLYERYVSTKDANGKSTETISYVWDSETNDWIENVRNVYTYDTLGNRIEQIRYNWDSAAKEWVGNSRRIMAYDTNGNKLPRSRATRY